MIRICNESKFATPSCENYYHLPGYSGKIPQISQMFGVNRSEISRRVFGNPSIFTQPNTLFSPNVDSIQNLTSDIRANSSTTDVIYTPHIITAGYAGHIPTIQEKFGRSAKHLYLKSIVDFEDNQRQNRSSRFDFQLQKLLENNFISKEDLPIDSMLHFAREQMPLKPINKYTKIFKPNEKDWNLSVYKMHCSNADKRFISGYQGHCPRLFEYFGETYDKLSHIALNDFTDIYRLQAVIRY